MAEGTEEEDRSQLLAHFQEITGIDDDEKSLQMLTLHNWDLEAAVQDSLNENEGRPTVFVPVSPPPTFSIGGADPQQEQVGAPQPSPEGQGTRTPGGGRTPVAIPQPQGWWEWMVNLAFFPLRFVVNTASDLLQFIVNLVFGFQPSPASDPQADVRQFIAEFESEHGRVHPDFLTCSYDEALARARQELQFLLVYLHSPGHEDTAWFCKEVLCSQQLVELVRGRMLVWGVSVNSEEGVRLSYILRENTYPFLALIVLKQGRMVVCERIEGSVPLDELMARLLAAVTDNEGELVVEREERMRRNESQMLREAQDQAYQESLAADREKERLRVEEQQRRMSQVKENEEREREQQRKEEDFAVERALRVSRLPEEPGREDANSIHVVLRLPSGHRLERRFRDTDKLESVYDFAYTDESGDLPMKFILITNFPRKELHTTPDDGGPLLRDLGLGKRCALFVQDTTDD